MAVLVLSLAFSTLVLATVILAAIALFRHFTKLRRCGIPGPTPLPFFGNILSMTSKGMDKTHETWIKQYGRLYGYYVGYRPNISVSDPEMLKIILVKEFASLQDRAKMGNLPKLLQNGLFFMHGRQWKRTRNILTPFFSAGKLKQMTAIIDKCAESLADNVQEKIGETATLRKVFGQFSMDVICSTAFGLDTNSQKQENEPFLNNISKMLNFGNSKLFRIRMLIQAVVPGIGPLLYKIGLSSWNNEAVHFFERTGKALIEDRIKNQIDRVDFLQMMIRSEFDETKEYHLQKGVTLGKSQNEGPAQELEGRLTLDEMNGTAFIFFIAGYETTATLLYFASYTLAVHPEIDRKLVEEIQECIGNNPLSYDSLGQLKYMDQFLQEVLRFYPSVPRFSRVALRDIQLGNSVIPKGTVVHIPVWFIHHSEEFYPDPETFDPSRFSGTSKADSVTFLPFGMGPRHCIGQRLALLEAKCALVHTLGKVRFVQTDKTEVPLRVQHYDTMRPDQPIQIGVEER